MTVLFFVLFGGQQMYRLSEEYRFLKDPSSLGDNIARHIREYQVYGRVAVVSAKPDQFLITLKKAWNDLKQETRGELAQTKDVNRKSRLINQLTYMPECTFTSKPPIEESFEKVQVATMEQFVEWPTQCHTMFVTYPVTKTQLYMATSWMPPYGLVIIYELSKGSNK